MIQLRNIQKYYDKKQLFNQFNLRIETNSKVLITAPSGTGKTTLIRMIMGYTLPDSGEIMVDNMTMSPKNIHQIRGQIAYVSQDVDLGNTTVSNQLDTIFHYKINGHIEHYKENFQKKCPSFGLDPFIIHDQIIKLSGGERQRVALIIALLLERPYLVLDEVTSGLDQSLKETIADLLMSLDKTIVIISHDQIWRDHTNLKEVLLNEHH